MVRSHFTYPTDHFGIKLGNVYPRLISHYMRVLNLCTCIFWNIPVFPCKRYVWYILKAFNPTLNTQNISNTLIHKHTIHFNTLTSSQTELRIPSSDQETLYLKRNILLITLGVIIFSLTIKCLIYKFATISLPDICRMDGR